MPDAYHQSLEAIKGDGLAQDRLTNGAEHENSANTQYYVQYAICYIDKHYQEDISLDMVSAKIGISPFYLSRLIKQIKGIAFIEYLTKVRISKAKEIALETELPISEIALKCGYPNITYFYKVFKKATGVTIGEFRKAARKDRER
jgi:two-component system response regulator YesN